MACPICNRFSCDHTPTERGQTYDEMMADYHHMTVEKYKASPYHHYIAPTKKKSKKEKTCAKKMKTRAKK